MKDVNLEQIFSEHPELAEEVAAVDLPKMTDAEYTAALAELEREREKNQRLTAIVESQDKIKQQSLTLRVSEKGGVSVYGLGRFPITLYPEQWLKLLSIADHIKAFIKENTEKLSFKK